MTSCILLDPSDSRWGEFVASRPDATIFHHPAWIELLAKCYGYRAFIVTVCDERGDIRAALPLMEVQTWLTSRRWVALPFSDYCNPLSYGDAWLERLTELLIALAHDRQIHKLETRWQLPFHPLLQSNAEFVLHVLELESDSQRVQSKFHRTQLQNIRRAEKEGVQIERGDGIEDMRAFYELQCLTRHRHGMPVQPWDFFERLHRNLLQQGLGFLLFGKYDGQSLAAGLFLHTNQTLTYKYAASRGSEGTIARANHLLTWEAIQWACRNGFRRLDFGRSETANTGLRTFKNRWGAQEIPLPYSHLPFTHAERGPSKVMPLMQFILRKAPPFAGIAFGKIFYKYFG